MTPHERALEPVALVTDDLYVARVLAPDSTATDAMVGFHLQQTVEKLLKALLAERNVDYPRTHNLLRLIHLVTEQGYIVPDFMQDLEFLTRYAVVERYEVQPPVTVLHRPEVLSLVEHFREWISGQLR